MTTTHHTLLEQLEAIDTAVLSGTATSTQERRGQEIATLANAGPELLEAIEYFFNIMHDYESSVRKGYVTHALEKAREAIERAKGGDQ